MAFMNKNQVAVAADILQTKTTEAQRLAKQADDAVDLVTRTIDNLGSINDKLDAAMADIDAYTAGLAETRDTMERQRKNNAAIISNFSKLLSTEEQ